MKALISAVSVAALAYAAVCAYVYFSQRALIYFPVPESNVRGAGRIAIENDGETLRVWLIGNRSADARQAIVYFGGNAEDVALNIPQFERTLGDSAIYLVNYRGYGGSTGAPTERALFADALAVFDYVQARQAEVSVVGRSLGSGVAVYLAATRGVKKLALVTPYDSLENVAAAHFRWLPISLLLKDRFASNARIGAVKAPMLILLAEHDEIIPRANSEALIALVPASQAKVVVLPGTDHNSVDAGPLYTESLRAFFL